MGITRLNSKNFADSPEKDGDDLKSENNSVKSDDCHLTLIPVDDNVQTETVTTEGCFGRFDRFLDGLNRAVQHNSIKILFTGLLILLIFCVPLKFMTFQTDLQTLWAEEGGRLEEELSYTQRFLNQESESNFQILMQKPLHNGESLLTQESLLTHLEILEKATKITVDLYDVKWRLKDLCYSPSFPHFEAYYIDQIFENFFPCVITTPLDCFWEGSKLLGPDYPVKIPILGSDLKWTNLNPQDLILMMKSLNFDFPFQKLENYMKNAGISSAYQEKFCLDPSDPECPLTAPNKNLTEILDVPGELSKGCVGFAGRFMKWPESLILGGTEKSADGNVVKAEALQSVIHLMGSRELYDFWENNYKIQHVDWTPEKAETILQSWQQKFSEAILNYGENSPSFEFIPFSQKTLGNTLQDSVGSSFARIAIAYSLMVLYAVFRFGNIIDPEKSYSILAILAILSSTLSTASGLGVCCLIQLPFTILTAEILILLSIALTFKDLSSLIQNKSLFRNNSGRDLVAGNLCRISGFLAMAMIPIPILRIFAFQAAILNIFSLFSTFFVFPAVLNLVEPKNRSLNIVEPVQGIRIFNKRSYQMAVLGGFFIFSAFSLWRPCFLEPGFEMADLIPRQTPDFGYFSTSEQKFGFYNLHMVTRGDFDYAGSQDLLREYLENLKTILPANQSEVPSIWLDLFRDWLINLQGSFDSDWSKGCINEERWFANASHEGILAYKLLVQTGNIENPVDKSLVRKQRLVNDGIIQPSGFYNYLTAWASNDPLGYGSSQGSLKPEPKIWVHNPEDKELKIPKSLPVQYAQIPVYLSRIDSTKAILNTTEKIRSFCKDFQDRGLPSYPSGIPFTFWEQFESLRIIFIAGFVCSNAAVFLMAILGSVNLKNAGILVAMATVTTIQISGFLGFLGIAFNAVPAGLFLLFNGIFADFCIPVLTDFSPQGSVTKSNVKDLIHNGVFLILSVSGLLFSQFNFITNYFFYGFAVFAVVLLINGLIVLPASLHATTASNSEEIQDGDDSSKLSTQCTINVN